MPLLCIHFVMFIIWEKALTTFNVNWFIKLNVHNKYSVNLSQVMVMERLMLFISEIDYKYNQCVQITFRNTCNTHQ